MDAHCERIRFMLDTGLERQKAVQTNLDSFFEPGTRKRKAGFHKTTMAQTRTLLDEQERTIKYLRTEMARVERAVASIAGIGADGDCSFETRSVLNKWVKPKDAEEALLLFFGYTKFEIKDQGGRDLAVLSPPDASAPVLYGEIDLDKLPSGVIDYLWFHHVHVPKEVRKHKARLTRTRNELEKKKKSAVETESIDQSIDPAVGDSAADDWLDDVADDWLDDMAADDW